MGTYDRWDLPGQRERGNLKARHVPGPRRDEQARIEALRADWPDVEGWWAVIRAAIADDPEDAAVARLRARGMGIDLCFGDAVRIAALRADDEAREATPDPAAREAAADWLEDWIAGTTLAHNEASKVLRALYRQPAAVQDAIRDLLTDDEAARR